MTDEAKHTSGSHDVGEASLFWQVLHRRRRAEESACAGIPTEALEAGVVKNMREALVNLVQAVGEAETDSGVVYCTSCAAPGGIKGQHDEACAVFHAQAVLAKATGSPDPEEA